MANQKLIEQSIATEAKLMCRLYVETFEISGLDLNVNDISKIKRVLKGLGKRTDRRKRILAYEGKEKRN